MARIAKSISINTDTDKDILEKLETVSNVSDYIKELIREDIKANSVSFTKKQKDEIEKMILKILNDNNFVKGEENNKSKTLSKEQSKALDDLLNI